ncbi:hypothetical protein [Romboutsia sp.]|uniref:hypothetical protein n=1 Tax=Romboutsia sp. TaxID=1965302 RepID=UPI002C6C80E0|nr:hypothetical protein [Romboutsia sp.]HSQ90438.1 hypothetical protein [Romboutsia sp.]
MSNEIIENERNKYKKTYTEMMFAYDDLRQMLDEKEINKRTFINKVDTLKEYIAFLDDLEKESKKDKGFFSKLLKSEKNIDDKIYKYLTNNKKIDIEKLEKCRQCKCRNCVKECTMNGCLNCKEKEFVYECNKEDAFLAKSDDTVTLYNGDEKYLFNVAGYLVEKDEDGNFSRYVYLIDSKDYDNQHILRYSKFKGEESYDSVIVDDKQDELVRINDKFIELGLKV